MTDILDTLLQNPRAALRELDIIDGEESLLAFTRRHWSALEPNTPFVSGWALEALCEHLQAITYGDLRRVLINVPPGFMKSLLTDVFWPAWEWGPQRRSGERYVAFSYAASLTERDNRRFRDLIASSDYQYLWGDRFSLRKQGETLVSNNKTGWKLATSIGGVGTGERGSRVILDDPHNVKESESDPVRQETIRWFRESMSNRLNDMEKSAVVIIMQRVHEEDVSGVVISEMGEDYEHLMIPMEWDGRRYHTSIGWTDPRQHDGELAWPERFPQHVVRSLSKTLGPFAYAGQYQQAPTPRGGGIIKRDYWQLWGNPDNSEDEAFKRFPQMDYVIASLDPAYTEKEENDYSALTVWGVFKQVTPALTARHWSQQGEPDVTRIVRQSTGLTKAMLMHAWRGRVMIHGPDDPKLEDESDYDWFRRCSPQWGLVEWSAWICRRFKVDRFLIEAKASGISVAQEMRRLYKNQGYVVQLVDPKNQDKVARAYAVQSLFSDGMIYAPDKSWADMVIDECATFPKGAHKDLVDATTQALKHLRDSGLLRHEDEIERDVRDQVMHKSEKPQPLYPT